MAENEDTEHATRTVRKRTGEVVPMPKAEGIDERTEADGMTAMIQQARDVMTVRRVYGEPIERDGVTIIPAANVRGGGGGGSGEGPQGQGRGSGGGFGVSSTPAGAFVIKDGVVKWSPAIDVNRAIIGGQIATIFFLLVVRSIAKALAKRH